MGTSAGPAEDEAAMGTSAGPAEDMAGMGPSAGPAEDMAGMGTSAWPTAGTGTTTSTIGLKGNAAGKST